MQLILLVLFLSTMNVWAGEVSLIERNAGLAGQKPAPEKKIVQEKKAPEKVPIDQSFEQMKEFMRQEDERIKTIKILNLDLERANLELKKGEVAVKIAAIGPSSSLSTGTSKPASPKLCGIFAQDNNKEALINVSGVYIQAGEGEALRDGVLVKKIGPEAVLLEYPDGKKETIELGS